MTDRLLQSVLFSAFDLAMQAKGGQIELYDIEELQTRAEQVLGSEHPASRAINDFATQHQLVRYDVEALCELGGRLLHEVEVLLRPVPPGEDRSDING